MSNPLYQAMMGNKTGNNLMQQIAQLKQMYPGDPNQYIQKLMNSGRVTQSAYNRAVQQAQQIQQFLGVK